MRHLVHLVKHWLIPGSTSMLLVSVFAGAILLNAGTAGVLAGRVWLTVVALAYWALSLPAVCSWLLRRKPQTGGQWQPPEFGYAGGTVVVVGNGSVHYSDGPSSVNYLTRRSVYAVFEAARVCALAGPDLVIATGGNATSSVAPPESRLIRDLLVACGVPAARIVLETESTTTSEQVRNVVALLKASSDRRPPIVVTTSAHMPRVVALFRSHGVAVVTSTTPELRYDEGISGWRRWWPSMSALTGSTSAVYEHLAALYDGARTKYRAGARSRR